MFKNMSLGSFPVLLANRLCVHLIKWFELWKFNIAKTDWWCLGHGIWHSEQFPMLLAYNFLSLKKSSQMYWAGHLLCSSFGYLVSADNFHTFCLLAFFISLTIFINFSLLLVWDTKLPELFFLNDRVCMEWLSCYSSEKHLCFYRWEGLLAKEDLIREVFLYFSFSFPSNQDQMNS